MLSKLLFAPEKLNSAYYISFFFSTAPPPYSQTHNGNAPGGGMTPWGVGNQNYASLYSAPPAYELTARAPGTRTTTTGIGSVTSLRDAAKDDE